MATWVTPRTWVDNTVVTAAQLNEISENLRVLGATGTYLFMHRAPTSVETLVNSKYLECNGVAVSRTTYAALFAVIGTTYGAGDGSTTFNLPDAHGRSVVSVARSGGHTDVTTLGASDSAALASRRPKHSHTVTDGHTHTASGTTGTESAPHTHTYTLTNVGAGLQTGTDAVALSQTPGTSTSTQSSNHTHSFSATSGAPSSTPTVGVAGMTDTPSYIVAANLFIAI